MDPTVQAAIVGLLGGGLAGGLAAWATLRSKKLDHAIEHTKLRVESYEKALFEQRLKDYRLLWSLTEGSSHRHVSSMTLESAAVLADKLTQWYYREGGILLSAEARNAFFVAREALDSFATEHVWLVTKKFSTLRTALCDDLNSRQGPTLQFDQDTRDRSSEIP